MRSVVTAATLLSALTLGSADDSPAAAAARKRQEAIRSVDFRFTVSETTEPGAIQVEAVHINEKSYNFPEKQFRCESSNRLLIDGDRIRFEDNHPIPNTSTRTWGNARDLVVFNGSDTKNVFGPAEGMNRTNAYGVIAPPNTRPVGEMPVCAPIHLTCRGGSPRPASVSSYLLGQYSPTGGRQRVNGVMLDEYADSRGRITLLIDPAQDHVVRRLRMNAGKTGQSPRTVIDVTHESHSSGVWLPSRWTVTSYNPAGRVQRVFVVTVDSATVNAAHPDSEFTLAFPPGIEVDDRFKDRTYLVRDDGSLAPMPKSNADPDQMLANLKSTWWTRNWWVIVLGIGAVTLATLALIRRIRRAKTANPPAG